MSESAEISQVISVIEKRLDAQRQYKSLLNGSDLNGSEKTEEEIDPFRKLFSIVMDESKIAKSEFIIEEEQAKQLEGKIEQARELLIEQLKQDFTTFPGADPSDVEPEKLFWYKDSKMDVFARKEQISEEIDSNSDNYYLFLTATEGDVDITFEVGFDKKINLTMDFNKTPERANSLLYSSRPKDIKQLTDQEYLLINHYLDGFISAATAVEISV